MNRALVRKVTAGLADYLKERVPDVAARGVVVGRDGRRMSPEFTEDVAAVLAGAGIKALVFPDVVPTPLCAYAVEVLGAAAGVMVTASHNPPAYNGYKVYWSNAAQIIPPHDAGISSAIDRVASVRTIPLLDRRAALETGFFEDIPESVGKDYIDKVVALRRHPEAPTDLTIVYTPLHGVGRRWVEAAFSQAGFESLVTVPRQADPDGEFPTVAFPNPEEKGAMDLALELATKVSADIVLANDPDADRLAVLVREPSDRYRHLTGNEIGILLAYYLLTENPVAGEPVVMTTIVSSSLLRRMAGELGAQYAETLTGFKWIANRALALREERGWSFVFGYEEALGYTVGELVRDKDGVGAALVFADLAGFCRARGQSVLDYLEAIYRRFGLYASSQESVTLPGSEGLARIREIMTRFRENPLSELCGRKTLKRSDLQLQSCVEVASGKESPLDFPKSDVLVYELEGGARVLLRPSGTEPKIKYYFEAVEDMQEDEAWEAAEGRVMKTLSKLKEEFLIEARRRGS